MSTTDDDPTLMRHLSSFRTGPLPATALALALLAGCAGDSASPALSPGAAVGQAGSLARFAIVGSTLYAVDAASLRTFSLSTPTAPVPGPVVPVGVGGVETIFPQDPYLFIGSQAGMAIFDVSGAAPRQIGVYQHRVSCDPVVVDGRYAYLTLRNNGPCARGQSQLDVVDLADLTRPVLVNSLPLSEPYGLGADNGQLFVCDKGIKVFDTRQAPSLRQVQSFSIAATDVIARRGVLLVTGADGFYQYRYSAAGNGALSLLSRIPVVKK